MEDLAEAVSTAGYPASVDALLAALVEGDRGYHVLARLVLARVEVRGESACRLGAGAHGRLASRSRALLASRTAAGFRRPARRSMPRPS